MNGTQFWSLAVSAIFVQNLVLIYFLWDKSFYKAIKKPKTGLACGIMVTAATTLSSILCWLLNRFVLRPFSLSFLAPAAYVAVIALIGIASGIAVTLISPKDKDSILKILPASAFGCAVLGLVLINVQANTRGFFGTAFYGLCAGIGYLAAIFLVMSALERVRFSAPPSVFKGIPIALVTAGIISLGLMGFSGIVIPY